MLSDTQRAQLIAAAASIRATLAEDDADRATAAAPSPLHGDADPATCTHPEDARVSTAAMGKPNAFFCRACRTEVEG